MWLGLWFLGGAVGISCIPHHQLPRRGARQSLRVVKMKNRLAEVSHHGAKGLQRERRDRGFVLRAGSSLLKQRRSCLVPPCDIPSVSHGGTIRGKSPRRRCSRASLGYRAPPELSSGNPGLSLQETGWGRSCWFCFRAWEGTVLLPGGKSKP